MSSSSASALYPTAPAMNALASYIRTLDHTPTREDLDTIMRLLAQGAGVGVKELLPKRTKRVAAKSLGPVEDSEDDSVPSAAPAAAASSAAAPVVKRAKADKSSAAATTKPVSAGTKDAAPKSKDASEKSYMTPAWYDPNTKLITYCFGCGKAHDGGVAKTEDDVKACHNFQAKGLGVCCKGDFDDDTKEYIALAREVKTKLTASKKLDTTWSCENAYKLIKAITDFMSNHNITEFGKLKINVPDTDDFPSGTDSPIVFTITSDKITEGFNLGEYELDGDEFEDE